jgi:NitT/TauT family transport system permease protein/putative hydroxymethylpyrimidine transport system permease protein
VRRLFWQLGRPLRIGWRPLAALAVLLGIWELYSDLGGSTRRLFLPPPHQVASALYTDRSLLWSNFRVTAEEVLLGILVAASLAIALAVLIHFSRTLRRALYPLIVASQTIPIPMLAVPLVIWLGFGIGPKLVVIAVVSFFPIVVTTLNALASVDPDLLKLMRTFDASRLRTFQHVELPSALPGVLTGAKVAVVVAVIGAVFAELAGADSGLGYLWNQSNNQLLEPRAYAAVVILSLFAIALFALLTLAERLAVPWAYQRREGEPNR